MKKIICVICIVLAFVLGACSTTMTYAEQTYPIKIWKHNDNGSYTTLCVVDENTGVNYIVVSGELYSDPIGIAITPRLNADGTLYVTGK